jgi:predicted amidohydrolase YtcJ
VNASTPDIILYNGTIATQNVQQPAAHAMAVAQGNILAVGSSDDILNLAGSGTEKIDLDGRLVVPGFIDTHIHFYEWALKRQGSSWMISPASTIW